MRRRLLGAAIVLAALAGPAAARPGYGEYVRAARLLQQWRFEEARPAIGRLEADAPGSPETRYLRAELDFLEGAYDKALERLDGLDDREVAGNVGTLRALARSTYEVTRDFERITSAGGHFVIAYPPGKEALIADLAGDALEAAYREIGADLGYLPPEPVRVEILHHPSDLARLSTLTEQEIETTGTIALCKYGKLMVVTPRATLFGYGWLDTMVHEYVHYVVSRASHDSVPVWLQEGLARFQQTRWRSPPGVRLSALDQHLLAGALKRGRLIGFDEMHPSMAKLPSAEAAALAFAEVYTMVGYLHDQVGYPGLRRALALMREGRSAPRALAEVGSTRWKALERAWRRHLRGLELRGAASVADRAVSRKVRFRKGNQGDDENAGLDLVATERARKHARLGGILRTRGLSAAAAIEYEKALAAAPDDTYVAAKLARTYLELGEHDKAIAIAAPLAAADEDDALPATTLGVAYLAKGDAEAAERAFVAALRVSPFDPTVRCGLADLYAGQGEARRALADRERKACTELGR